MIRLILLFIFIFSGCTLAPTKVEQEHKGLPFEIKTIDYSKPIEITPETVIVDARSNFEYATVHIRGSIQLNWEDFTARPKRFPGKMSADYSSLTRRLALLGIHPGSQVVVVGQGRKGMGEEGRLAWTLFFLGIKDVRFATLDFFQNISLTTEETKPRANVPPWKTHVLESVRANKDEVKSAIDSQEQSAHRPVLLDVRTEKEYLNKAGIGLLHKLPNFGTINIPWKEFITNDGLPNKGVVAELKAMKIHPEQKIIVISEKGVRSALVTMALIQLGYTKAANFDGGIMELIDYDGGY